MAGAWGSRPDQREHMRMSKLCASPMVVPTKSDTTEECSLRNVRFQQSVRFRQISVGTQCVEEDVHDAHKKLVVKESKTVMTQSQTTYKRYLAQPRFHPLAERVHGAWSDLC